jgi:glycosyltransferase involved in cell wall biosynthesis
MLISIIIPVYNEQNTINKLIEEINALKINKEIIIIDDGSTDQTLNLLQTLNNQYKFILLRHEKNLGKGTAIKTGLKYAQGEIIIIQDADLETDPSDCAMLVNALRDINIDAVLSYRIRSLKNIRPFILKIYYLGSKLLTILTNILFFSNIKDVNSGCKALRNYVIKDLNLQSNGFEIDEEIAIKLLKKNYNFIQIPLDYTPRNITEGKKVTIFDGIKAFFTVIKFKFQSKSSIKTQVFYTL